MSTGDHEQARLSRRDVLRRGAVAGGVGVAVWAAPGMTSRAWAGTCSGSPNATFCGIYSFEFTPPSDFVCISPRPAKCGGLPQFALPPGYSFVIDDSDYSAFKIQLMQDDPGQCDRKFADVRVSLPTTGDCVTNSLACRTATLSTTINTDDTATFNLTGVDTTCLENHLTIEFRLIKR